MAKSSDTHELTPEQTKRCKRQIGLATAVAVIVDALLWVVAVRLGLTSFDQRMHGRQKLLVLGFSLSGLPRLTCLNPLV
ncbi:MAG: hypothetical protein CBARDCOR_5124 [uncultured Caballeronia sp.]|nr:MAG: hypothetical protein CBARDCOR_5124 [uncultured Caballeronia sp.]